MHNVSFFLLKEEHKHTKAPKNCCHKYNILHLCFLVTYGNHILDYFCLF
jgi:hypothetical protein